MQLTPQPLPFQFKLPGGVPSDSAPVSMSTLEQRTFRPRQTEMRFEQRVLHREQTEKSTPRPVFGEAYGACFPLDDIPPAAHFRGRACYGPRWRALIQTECL